MISILRRLLAALMLLGFSLSAQSQTIVQNAGDIPATTGGLEATLGQGFVTTVNGSITALGVRSLNSVTATLRIYVGGAGSGTPGVVGAPAYTQTNVALTTSTGAAVGPAGGFTNIPLTTPFAVTAGHTFTFQLTAPTPFSMAAQTGNPYTPGSSVFNYGTLPIVAHDMAFQVFEVVAAVAPGTPAAIPTLGEWAMLVLAATLTMLAVARLRRSSRT
jgi:hypothetical protein